MSTINLNDNWQVRSEELWMGRTQYDQIIIQEKDWMDVSVPCDVHMPLLMYGLIQEPLEKENFKDCRWVEEKSWWFKKELIFDEFKEAYDRTDLVFESLDSEADIFFNGIYIGHQKGSFYPFVRSIKEYIIQGKNLIMVRVTSGLEHYSEDEISDIKKSDVWAGSNDDRGSWGDPRRMFVRKPQYVYGWDHSPRLATCGIMGNVNLVMDKTLCIKNISVQTKSIFNNDAMVTFAIEVESFTKFSLMDASFLIEVHSDETTIVSKKIERSMQSGLNFFELDVLIKDAKLWWPNGMGEQFLYSVKVAVEVEDKTISYKSANFGIRKINLNMDNINKEEKLFALEINGKKVFCKGANWVPADCIYSRVEYEKYNKLLHNAAQANFNLLRVWGGGIYEKDIFYELCDQLGIMVWQDFMFSCALYPDNREWFQKEVEKEAEYQTVRLRNHPSVVVWCGNNENHWFMTGRWTGTDTPPFFGGEECYNYILPSIMKKNCPDIPYWRSSPYGDKDPNNGLMGDVHFWGESFMNGDINVRITPEIFDDINVKFVSEYGFTGPTCIESIKKFHGSESVNIGSTIWCQHTNRFEGGTTLPAIYKHYTEKKDISIPEYLLYAGLFQGTMYQYSLESIRFSQNCWGSLFWDYNDSWGEFGWSIIDYYVNRKISYYFVKRAFAHVKLILREKDGIVKVMGINDTGTEYRFDVDYGYLSFDGLSREVMRDNICLEPYSRKIVMQFEKTSRNPSSGCVAVIPKVEGLEILPAILRTGCIKDLILPKPELQVILHSASSSEVTLKVSSNSYAHAVHFNMDIQLELSDEYFDLLPGESRYITLTNIPDNFKFIPEFISSINVVSFAVSDIGGMENQ